MGLFANLVCVMLAGGCAFILSLPGRHVSSGRHRQLTAIALLFVILYPVISVGDDLWSMQNPEEAKTWQRRDHRTDDPHRDLPLAGTLPERIFTEVSFGMQPSIALLPLRWHADSGPSLDPFESRPPPAV